MIIIRLHYLLIKKALRVVMFAGRQVVHLNSCEKNKERGCRDNLFLIVSLVCFELFESSSTHIGNMSSKL